MYGYMNEYQRFRLEELCESPDPVSQCENCDGWYPENEVRETNGERLCESCRKGYGCSEDDDEESDEEDDDPAGEPVYVLRTVQWYKDTPAEETVMGMLCLPF